MDIDWTSGMYYDIKLDWIYDQQISVDLSIPKYVPNALHKFQHPYPKIPQHAPHKRECPNYGAKTEWAKEESSLEILPEKRKIQNVLENFLYNSQAFVPTLLVALG